ncbi:uncharacterized protein [Antedon mediterranea]|uniref:uncharacterized protein n=1 Tax=Antedon mediterranea TaxID=105859 RepID=UPI003AF44A46
MGSPVSPLIANIYLEWLEEEAIKSADRTIKQRFWRRYVDDVFAIVHKDAPLPLNRHLDSIDPSDNIKFTTEIMSEKQIPFLDMIITIKQDGTLATKVYRKPTHTDQYLDFHSNHPLEHKLSVVNTLVNRADTIVSEEKDKKHELEHIRKALKICNYPKWSVDRVVNKRKEQKSINKSEERQRKEMEKMKAHIGIPYIHGISEKIRRTFAKHKVNTFFIPSNKLKNGLVHPKDRIKTEDMCGVIYEVNCLNCEKVYIGETGRALNTRIGEHKKDVSTHNQVVRTRANRNSSSKVLHKSAITDHAIGNDHIPNWNARVIEKEAQTDKRKIKESICIRKRPHNINRDIGGYDLPHTYDSLLEKVEAGGGQRRRSTVNTNQTAGGAVQRHLQKTRPFQPRH